MTSHLPTWRGRLLTTVVVGTLATAPAPNAQTARKFETFTGTTVNLAVGSGETLRMNVFQWSPEDERSRMLTAFQEKGGAELLNAVRSAPSAGYLWTSESLGYTLRYAHHMPLPNGGERVILLAERRLGSWSGTTWKASNPASAPDYEFTLIELRLNRQGAGEGKMSLAAKVTADPEGKTIALDQYDAAPILLKGVGRVGVASDK